MKKTILTLILGATAMTAVAQSTGAEVIQDTSDANGNVVTIADIVELQQRVTSQQSTSSHFEKVWGYKSFFNISYLTSATLTPKEDITLGYEEINNNKVPDFKADYGVALQLGHCYNLHKKPIANIVSINLDYTYIDLSMAHYKKEPGTYVYNSDNTWKESGIVGKTYSYIPWCLGKYDINFGMNIGPSVTVVPLTFLDNLQGLHFLKFNFYYHIGYQIGVLWMPNDLEANASEQAKTPTVSASNDSDPMKLNWQHGLVQSFGFNLSWKSIGVGFEKRVDNRTYKSFNTSEYGSNKYKFKGSNSRIYLRICY